MYREIEGDLLSDEVLPEVDVIAHGCNCFNVMGAGIAFQIANKFDEALKVDLKTSRGDINKLGNYTHSYGFYKHTHAIDVINCYTQYLPGKHLDYEALTLCLRKINHEFKGKRIGLPQIGCGLAGGNWDKVKQIIQTELKDCEVTVVIYKK